MLYFPPVTLRRTSSSQDWILYAYKNQLCRIVSYWVEPVQGIMCLAPGQKAVTLVMQEHRNPSVLSKATALQICHHVPG